MSSVLLRLSVALAATLPLFVSASQAQPTEEYAVKAAFLYNFARFTEWPADSFASDSAPFVLCIVGRDPFGQALEAVEGRSVKGHAVRIDRRPAADKLRDCHIAFISQSERSRVRTVLKSAENDPVLTVSDIDHFARLGGMIALVTEGGKIRFEINIRATERAQLKLSSQLLKLASLVRE